MSQVPQLQGLVTDDRVDHHRFAIAAVQNNAHLFDHGRDMIQVRVRGKDISRFFVDDALQPLQPVPGKIVAAVFYAPRYELLVSGEFRSIARVRPLRQLVTWVPAFIHGIFA